jgi:ABC-2 type transport system ATP-binding protein
MHTIVVSANNVSVEFGDGYKALNDINLELPAGKITGLIGPSGAGKTTLIRAIVGRIKVTAGTISVLGSQAGSAGLRGKFSYMTQSLSVYPDITVKENFAFFACMLGLSGSNAKAFISETLQRVDLVPQADQIVTSLSGGQKQRVSLGVALLGDPELLVLDEPTVGLDPVLREQLWKLFRQLVESGKTIIISSHVMDEADRCDSLVLIRDGKVLAHATPAELVRQTGARNVEDSFIKLVGDAQ